MIVEEPDTMVKQITKNTNQKNATVRSTKECKTIEASTDNQPQHQREKDKTYNLKKSWKLLSLMKLGYITRKTRLRTLQPILTRPIREDKKNKLKAP